MTRRSQKRKHYANELLGFGRYKHDRWRDIPDDYLDWLLDNMNDWLYRRLAQIEKKRRYF